MYDHLSDAAQTPVGNTYTLVEYVTAGGVSMATYVATNVQNFPEGTFPDGDQDLVVHADLASPIQDGGLTIAAFSGVGAVTAEALSGHLSATGSGSTYPTIADPGSLPIDAGAHSCQVSCSWLRAVESTAEAWEGDSAALPSPATACSGAAHGGIVE